MILNSIRILELKWMKKNDWNILGIALDIAKAKFSFFHWDGYISCVRTMKWRADFLQLTAPF